MSYNSEPDQTSPYACFGRRLDSILQPSAQACPALTRACPVVYETYPESYAESYSDAYSGSYPGTSSQAYAEPYVEPCTEYHPGPCNQTNIQYNVIINADPSSSHQFTLGSGPLLEECASSSGASGSTARPPAPSSSSSRRSAASKQSSKRYEDWLEQTQTAVGSLASYNESVSTRTTSDHRSHGRSSHYSHASSFQDDVGPEDSISQVSAPRKISSSKGHHGKSSRGSSSDHHKSEAHSHRTGHSGSSRASSYNSNSHSHSHKKAASSIKGSEYSHGHSSHSTHAPRYADSITEEPEDMQESHYHPRHNEPKKKQSRDEHVSHKKKHGSSHHSTHHSSSSSQHSSPAKNKKGSRLVNYLLS
ncbi:hypothetical protein F4678DRAFT_459924 [Xylaria arbuscula]|nr:hypothetical protein F4678DRAFT_459924 [Xylaria arbuscula]